MFQPRSPDGARSAVERARRALFTAFTVSTGAFYSSASLNALKRQFHLSQQELVNINTIPYMVCNHRAHA